MHAFFLGESCWIHNFSHSFPKLGVLLCSSFARHCRIHWNFQLSPCDFDGFFIFTIFQIDEINASHPSSIIEFGFLVCPVLLFSLLSGFSDFGPYFRPHMIWSSSCFNLSPDNKKSLWRFLFQKVNFVNHFQESHKLRFASTFQ